MKKKFISYIAYAFTAFPITALFASCSDFLNEEPQTDFTADATNSDEIKSKYTNIDEAMAELQGAYEGFKNDIFQLENFMAQDVQSDNCYVGGDGINEEQEDLLTITATNAKPALVWSQYMSMAGNATNVIENIKLMDSKIASDDEKNEVMAHAHFIRAWAYFDMVRLWGGIPMVRQLIPTITAENLDKLYPVMYPARSTEAEVYKQILSDLDETIISHLPAYNKGTNRATQGAAYGLLAKVYATMGKKSERNYNKVVECCDHVISQGYKLVDNFEDLWQPNNKFTSESIFELYFTTDSPNWAYWVLLKETDDGSVTWRRYCAPSHDLVAKFDKDNDKRYTSSIIWKNAPYNTYWHANNYAFAYKIREKNSEIILMRLADIMLLKAEALVELNRTSEAIDIVNIVRGRAGVKVLNNTMSQDEARLAVENERQLELFMEGHRWNDLVRNDRMLEVMRKHKDHRGQYIFANLKEYRRYWPIPQNELDKNTNLVQNEGY